MLIRQRGAYVVLSLLITSSASLHAQPLRCRTEVENFAFIRLEGIHELVGDLVITCTGGVPTPAGQPIPTIDLEVELNAQVTSRVLEGDLVEALLFINDPRPELQVIGQNVFQGKLVGERRIRWTGVRFNPPGADRRRVLRLKNIRVDASRFENEPNGVGNVALTLSATGLLEDLVEDQPLKVAIAQAGLDFSIGDALGGEANARAKLLRSHDNNGALYADPTADFSTPGGRSFTLRFEEKIETAFRRRVFTDLLGTIQSQADPASPSVTESGFFNPAFPEAGGLNRAGLADHSTRLRAAFRNVPEGVAIFVTVAPVRPGSTRFVDAELLSTDDAGATKDERVVVSPTSLADNGIAQVPIANGEGRAVWEITAADLDAIDTVSFGVTVAYFRDVPRLGTAFVEGGFAPLISPPPSAPTLPRFSNSPLQETAFQITLGDACGVAVQDVVLGGLDDPLKDDIFAFDALMGTLLDLDVKAKGGNGPVEMRLFDPFLRSIDIDPFIKARGRAAKLKGFPLFATGRYQVVLRSADGSSTDYRLKVRGKLPKSQLKLKARQEVGTPGEIFIQSFEAVAGSVLNVTLKGKGTDPEILELIAQPPIGDASVLPFGSSLKPGSKTVKVKGFLLPTTASYRLTFTGLGAPGILSLSISVKGPGKRVLEECLE